MLRGEGLVVVGGRGVGMGGRMRMWKRAHKCGKVCICLWEGWGYIKSPDIHVTHVLQTLPCPWQWAHTAACNYRSNLGSVHQVPITAGWTKAVWNTKFTRHFYTWPALGIEPQTIWSWVQRPIHLAPCSHDIGERKRRGKVYNRRGERLKETRTLENHWVERG